MALSVNEISCFGCCSKFQFGTFMLGKATTLRIFPPGPIFSALKGRSDKCLSEDPFVNLEFSLVTYHSAQPRCFSFVPNAVDVSW